MMDRIEIPFSKARLLFALAISVALTVWLLDTRMHFISADDGFAPGRISAAEAACFLLFSLFNLVVFAIFVISFTRPGLIIDQYGITDQSGFRRPRLIEWQDITGMEISGKFPNYMLQIYVRNLENYVTGKHTFQVITARQKGRMGDDMDKEPLSIMISALKCKPAALVALLRNEMTRYTQ